MVCIYTWMRTLAQGTIHKHSDKQDTTSQKLHITLETETHNKEHNMENK
jgi:hypothetical protein